MTPLRVILLTVFITAIAVQALAASIDEVQTSYNKLALQSNQVRGLALSILKDIKQIDTECRDSEGDPVLTRMDLARDKLGRVELMRVSFNAACGDAEISRVQVSVGLKSLADDEPLVVELKPALAKISADMVKYRRYVDHYYQKTIDDFGQPTATLAPLAGVGVDKNLVLTGEATAELANSKYERVNTNPAIKVSGMDLSFGLKGKYTPTTKTSVLAHIDHESTVEQREIGLTNLGASVIQQFSPDFSATAGFDLNKYSDKENDIANFNDFGMFARAAYQNQGKRFDVNVRQVKRSYGNVDDNTPTIIPDNPPRLDRYKPEYTTTSLTTRATMPIGQGQIKAQLRYFKKTVGNKFFDFTEMNPSLIWILSPSGSELGASYQKFTHPNQDSATTDNNRIKLHYYAVSRNSEGSTRWGPEVMMYRYPLAEERDYSDFKLMRQTDSRGKRYSPARWEIAYRLYSDTTQFDFAQLQYRKKSRPLGSGKYSSFNLAMRYYTEASNEDDSLRFGNVHPAHTLDTYWDFGWSMRGASWMQRLTIGPILATRMFFDTERADAFDADFVDIDFVLLNPRNSARAGFKVGMSGASPTGVSWQADVSYVWSMLYNADPKRTTNILELNTQVNYPVNEQWFVEGYSKVHRTRAEVASPADLNKLDIGIRARYLFDLAQ